MLTPKLSFTLHLSALWQTQTEKKSLLRHLMTTPNMSVCYTYSLPGSISRLLQEARICLLLRYQTPASPPNPTFQAPTWKSLFSGNQEGNSATLNSSISLGTTTLKTRRKRQRTQHSWLPSPATSLQFGLEIAWAYGSGHLQSDLAHCSVLWSPTLTWRRWGKRVGKRSIQSPLLAAVRANPVFHKPHPELSSHHCYPTHMRQNPVSQIRNTEI